MPKKTGILVIHGIGEQSPYETLDIFTANLVNYFQSLPNQNEKIKLLHHRQLVKNNDFDDYVSILQNDIVIEVHEYYWAHMMNRDITLTEVINWLIQTSEGATDFYDKNQQYMRNSGPFKNGKFIHLWYVKQLGGFIKILSAIPWFVNNLLPSSFEKLIHLFLGKARKMFINYIGDIVIYTSSDIKSKYYTCRQQVLDGSVEKLKRLLLDNDYDQIYVVGHSMGSVIAYDGLNRINHLINHNEELSKNKNKIKGLITIGSPLDKVAFFFRDRAKNNQYVRRFIIQSIHGFRTREKTEIPQDIMMSTLVNDYLKHVDWINIWNAKDPVSGHLDFYSNVINIEIDSQNGWGTSHIKYWTNPTVYQKLDEMMRKINSESDEGLTKESGEEQAG